MGGVVRGIRRAVGGVVRGVGSAIGGVVRGVGHLARGRLDKAVGSVVGGVVKGTGHVLKGGLGAVSDVLGDPVVGVLAGVAGFGAFGIGGAVAGPLLAKFGSKVFGAAEKGVGNLFGLNQQQHQHLNFGHNYGSFGPNNAHFGAYPGGLRPPFYGPSFPSPFGSGYPMPMPQVPSHYHPPTYGCTPCHCQFS